MFKNKPVEKRLPVKRIVLGSAGVAALVALGFGALAWRAPVEGAGDRLIAALTEATGLTVKANGAADVSLFPSPRVRVPGLSLSRGSEPPFAVARELSGSLRLWPLVMGRIELSEITLNQPDVALDRTPLGDALESFRHHDANVAPPSLRLTDGRLRVAGRVIDKVEAGLVWPSDGGPLAISGFGLYAGKPVEATFQLTDLGALADSRRAPFRARIEGGGARLMFDGEAHDAKQDGSADDAKGLRLIGGISARAVSLGDTLAWLGLARPAKSGPAWSLSLAGQGTLDREGLAVSNAELDLSGDSFMGAGRLTATADGRPSIEATLDAGDLNMATYASVLAPEIMRDGAWSEAEIDLAGLKGWTLDLRLSAESIRFGRLALGQTAATVAVGGGGLDLSIGEAAAYGGSIGGRLSLEPDPRGARMELEGAASEVALDEAFRKPPLAGAMTGEISVTSSGRSAAEFVARLAGKASARLADGALEHIGGSRTLALAGLGRRMKVETASARFRIENGVALADDVSIVGRDATFAFAGQASLVARELNLRGSVRPADGGWALPVTLEGKLAAPKLRPDLGNRAPHGEARRDGATAPSPAAN